MKKISLLSFILIAVLMLSIPVNAQTVKMETSMGDIVIELNKEKAPVTVENFMKYVNDKYYDGLIFHRVINNFMVQGGGFKPGMKQQTPAYDPIKNEAYNGLKNDTGTIAMARTGAPHSATAQFFINVKDNSFLNHKNKTPRGWGYTVFGKVTKGMDVVNKIKVVKTGSHGHFKDVPVKDVVIKKVYLLKGTEKTPEVKKEVIKEIKKEIKKETK